MKFFLLVVIAFGFVIPGFSQEKVKVRNATVYTCPMHPDIRESKPGVCPKCGMQLVEEKIKNEKAKGSKLKEVNYRCPMHPEVTSDKPGKCSKCRMNLIKVKQKTQAA